MCLIIHNPKGTKLKTEVFEDAIVDNPDGFGIFYHDDGSIRKYMDPDDAEKAIMSGRPYTAHFRYATSGTIGKEQCHPFHIDKSRHLMMNGTISRLVSKSEVDTQVLCRILSGLSDERILSILQTYECRFVLLNKRRKEATVVNRDLWSKRDGILFSKLPPFYDNKSYRYSPKWDYKTSAWSTDEYWGRYDEPEKKKNPVSITGSHTIAVYGTLKSGYGNHQLIKGSKYLGSAVTEDKLPLVVNGLPYLFDEPGSGKNVKVEVYEVSSSTLERVDQLEGHPDYYQRRMKRVVMDGTGEKKLVWIYVIPPDRKFTHTGYTPQLPHLDSYK